MSQAVPAAAAIPLPLHAPQALPSAEATTAPAEKLNLKYIVSPMVGTFYRAPSPESQVYIEKNDNIKKGHVMCIIEAMKLFNEIESDVSGRVVEILVENGSSVEYGEKLFAIEV